MTDEPIPTPRLDALLERLKRGEPLSEGEFGEAAAGDMLDHIAAGIRADIERMYVPRPGFFERLFWRACSRLFPQGGKL